MSITSCTPFTTSILPFSSSTSCTIVRIYQMSPLCSHVVVLCWVCREGRKKKCKCIECLLLRVSCEAVSFESECDADVSGKKVCGVMSSEHAAIKLDSNSLPRRLTVCVLCNERSRQSITPTTTLSLGALLFFTITIHRPTSLR